MTKADSDVSNSLANNPKWDEAIEILRNILLDCDLTEETKWGKPTFMFQGNNIVIVQGFNEYCALLFPKGMLLKDPKKILQKTGENTRVGRQIKFHSVREITDLKDTIKDYIRLAIEVEKSGKKVPPADNSELELPEELINKFEEVPALRDAWERLTPGRQRGYIYFFTGSKNPETREARIEKNIDRILDGIGLNEYY